MKRALSIPLLIGALMSPLEAPAQTLPAAVITNNTIVTTWSDSFGLGTFGQRQNFFIASYFVNYFPQYFVGFRDHSKSGGNNGDMVQQRMPQYGIPDAGASWGTTNGLNIYWVSANGGFDSNTMFGFFTNILQYPTNSYVTNVATASLYLTNDWTQANADQLYKSIVIGDLVYSSLSTADRDRSYGGRSAAIAVGAPFVDSWSNLVSLVSADNGDQSLLWFPNGGAYDHPDNTYQLCWALSTLIYPTNNSQGFGVDTNTYTLVLDGSAVSVSSTNHCTATSLSGSSGNFTFTFHADRMAPGFYVPDGTTTNDCRGAFGANGIPALGNAFCEIWRITNLPPGTYRVVEDGYCTNLVTSAQFAAGWNRFTNYNNPLWNQKLAVLYAMCDQRDILRTDNSTAAHGGAGELLSLQESFGRTVWPTNDTWSVPGASFVTKYVTNYWMELNENGLVQNDVLMHAAAQQTNHTISIALITPRYGGRR